jgi:hypothetical protein
VSAYPNLTHAWRHRVHALNEGGPLWLPTVAVRLTPFFLYLRVGRWRASLNLRVTWDR